MLKTEYLSKHRIFIKNLSLPKFVKRQNSHQSKADQKIVCLKKKIERNQNTAQFVMRHIIYLTKERTFYKKEKKQKMYKIAELRIK